MKQASGKAKTMFRHGDYVCVQLMNESTVEGVVIGNDKTRDGNYRVAYISDDDMYDIVYAPPTHMYKIFRGERPDLDYVRGGKIQAIESLLGVAPGLGLKEAKEFCEAIGQACNPDRIDSARLEELNKQLIDMTDNRDHWIRQYNKVYDLLVRLMENLSPSTIIDLITGE